MKTPTRMFLSATVILAVALAGCGKSNATSAAALASAVPPSGKTPAAIDRPASGRAIAITANDAMKFNVTEIRAKPGEALAVTLANEGTVPKFSMGHNFVLLAPDVDLNAFSAATAEAATTEYVPASFKDKVLAATKLLGPKESATALFYAPKQPGRYPFVCSFPGHMQVGMKGELIVE